MHLRARSKRWMRVLAPVRFSRASGCSRQTGAVREDDRGSDGRRFLVFPISKDPPPCLCELSVCFTIPLDVAGQLRPPVVGVALRQRRMLRTTVPEAAVYEHRYPPSWEDDVRPTAPTYRSEVDPVPHPGGVQQTSYGQLRRRIPAAVSAHRPPRPLVTGPRHSCTVTPTAGRCRTPPLGLRSRTSIARKQHA